MFAVHFVAAVADVGDGDGVAVVCPCNQRSIHCMDVESLLKINLVFSGK